MQVERSASLAQLTTMRLGGQAAAAVTVESPDELEATIQACAESEQPFFVLGGGSNVIARDKKFDGTLILNRIQGFETVSEDKNSQTIKIGAGENWDQVVEKTVGMGLTGIEALSAVPGLAGATPVQNVGAYGQEIADTLVELEALDTETMEFVTVEHQGCGFAYRDSVFKDPATRHHIITSITLKLTKGQMKPPFYTSLQNYLDQHGIDDYSPRSIRQAVVAIRATKLPDPSRVANSGSFFKNPIVEESQAEQLARDYPDIPQFPLPNVGVKLAAGWLIEQAGLKGYAEHGFTTSPDNALVVINQSAGKYAELDEFKSQIVGQVSEKFGVTLEQEPETL